MTAAPTTFVVNSTGDQSDVNTNDGFCYTGQSNAAGAPECTLRAAIQQSNATAADETISFDIPNAASPNGYGPAPHVINVNFALPGISDTVTINGLSEPDIVRRYMPSCRSGTLAIQINGITLDLARMVCPVQYVGS